MADRPAPEHHVVIVNDGSIAAIVDWGDITVGEPACDLAGAFMLVPDHIEQVAAEAGATDEAWIRARGWAAHVGATYLAFGDDDAVMASIAAAAHHPHHRLTSRAVSHL